MKVQEFVRVLSAVALLAFTTVAATAAPFTFTHAGSGSGSLAGVPFAVSDFVITAVGDTTDRVDIGFGFFIDHSSASIAIQGLGTFDFVTATLTFVNNPSNLVGFSSAEEVTSITDSTANGTPLLGITGDYDVQRLVERLGEPTRVSSSADGLQRHYFYAALNVTFTLEKGHVAAWQIFNGEVQ